MADSDALQAEDRPSVPTRAEHPAVASLRTDQTQLDLDGVMVGVSRQAVAEVLALHDETLTALEAAAAHLVGWCERIAEGRTSWDDWDEFYKDAHYEQTQTRPGLNNRLLAAIAKATGAAQ